jgi:hypothetical protein
MSNGGPLLPVTGCGGGTDSDRAPVDARCSSGADTPWTRESGARIWARASAGRRRGVLGGSDGHGRDHRPVSGERQGSSTTWRETRCRVLGSSHPEPVSPGDWLLMSLRGVLMVATMSLRLPTGPQPETQPEEATVMTSPLGEARAVTKLPAQNLDRARRFYRDRLGLEPAESAKVGCGTSAGPRSSTSSRPPARRPGAPPSWASRSRTSTRPWPTCGPAASSSRPSTWATWR